MAEHSSIEWTDHTFNPWMGCTKVSGACKHCYAETLMDTRWGKVQWGPKGERVRTSDANWRKPLAWNRQAEATGTRPRVFCASLADVFEGADTTPAEAVALVEQARRDLWELIEATPHLDWLLLTKRPENVLRMVPPHWVGTISAHRPTLAGLPDWPANVWLGTTVEDQQSADERIPHLLRVPASVRFLSCEPLLGPVDIGWYLQTGRWDSLGRPLPLNTLQWVIAGGESGHGARPSHPDWFRSLRDQCQQAGVPYLFKQWGAWAPYSTPQDRGPVAFVRHSGEIMTGSVVVAEGPGVPGPCFLRRVGKHAAGRILDGRTWDEVPRG